MYFLTLLFLLLIILSSFCLTLVKMFVKVLYINYCQLFLFCCLSSLLLLLSSSVAIPSLIYAKGVPMLANRVDMLLIFFSMIFW